MQAVEATVIKYLKICLHVLYKYFYTPAYFWYPTVYFEFSGKWKKLPKYILRNRQLGYKNILLNNFIAETKYTKIPYSKLS